MRSGTLRHTLPLTYFLTLLLQTYLVAKGGADAAKGAYSMNHRHPGNYARKIMCHECHMPYQCATGFCYGDFCVKSLVADRYVSKGCENVSNNPSTQYTRHFDTPTNAEESDYSAKHPNSIFSSPESKSACHQIDIFGVPNTVCYCNNADYCNGAQMSARVSTILLVTWLLSYCFLLSLGQQIWQ